MATVSDVRTAAATTMATAAARAERVVSLDVIRGIVMVLMALDHVRVYSGLPAGGPTAGIFFTRWVTHFCAPAFAFLAGTSAYLSRRRRTAPELSWHLLTRGAWLVLLELTVIRLAWTFNVDYSHYILFGVIWMLGICMMLMAPLVRAQLSTRTIAIVGLVVIFAQDLIGLAAQALPAAVRAATGPFWQFLYFGGVIRIFTGAGAGAGAGASASAGAAARGGGEAGTALAVLYSIVPWIGVMAAGYAFGAIVTRDAAARRRACLWIGLSATALFVVIAGTFVLMSGNTNVPAFVRFLNQRKYPASQLFLLMTLGPTIAFVPFADRMRGPIGNGLAVFGRVPFFYYLLHIPLIHLAAMIVSLIREGRVNPWLFGNHPMMPPPLPEGYMWSLPLLYLVWAIVIAILYLPCRWFAEQKKSQPESWLRFF